MRLNKAKGRMFRSVTHTATYIGGCDHDCDYCWAKVMGLDMTPRLVQKDEFQVLRVRDAVIFLNSAYDPFCPAQRREWIEAMLRWIGRQHPSNKFLLQTKNPARFLEFLPLLEEIKDRVRLGTTIETNWEHLTRRYSKAPDPYERYIVMRSLNDMGFETFLSLEPLMDFHPLTLSGWVMSVNPVCVEIGLDNYSHRHGHKLPLPSPEKYEDLKGLLAEAGVTILEKGSMDKLKEGLANTGEKLK